MNTAFASGKIILLGEHAAVYGRPAIAAALDRGAVARVTPARAVRPSVVARGADGAPIDSGGAFDRALEALLDAARSDGALDVEVDLEIAPGGGLGSSAAMGLAIARALDPFATDADLYARTMAWERVFHGSPSGIDVAASLLGGCVRFQRGEPARRLSLSTPLLFCVGHSGTIAMTSTMVERVARARAADPSGVDAAFDTLASAAENAEHALVHGDRARLGRILGDAHALLAWLGVSTPALDRMCQLADHAGARGAKLTGAGGGGAVIALVDGTTDAERVLAAWRDAGFDGTTARVPNAPADSGTRLVAHAHDRGVSQSVGRGLGLES